MKLSRSTAYAIRALLQLPEYPASTPTSNRSLALDGALPERFLLQILRNLVKHGILSSVRGVQGGYSLTRPLCEINLLQIIEAVDGPIVMTLPEISGTYDAIQEKLASEFDVISANIAKQLSSANLAKLKSVCSEIQSPHAVQCELSSSSV